MKCEDCENYKPRGRGKTALEKAINRVFPTLGGFRGIFENPTTAFLYTASLGGSANIQVIYNRETQEGEVTLVNFDFSPPNETAFKFKGTFEQLNNG